MNDTVIALIPAFNEAARLPDVVTRVRPHVREVIVIDDGSTDPSGAVARAAGATLLRHEQNQGKGASILTGLDYFRRSDAAFAVLLDADGQHDPAEIPAFVAAARETGASIVVGTRMQDTKAMPWVRLWTNRFTSWLIGRLAGQKIPDSQCGYRLLARSVLPNLNLSTARFETESEMLIQAGRAGHRIASVPVRTIYAGETSHIRPGRDTLRFLQLMKKYW